MRSTDLLSLPNVNPDAGYGMQMSIEDSLTDVSQICFQAALLYTSSKGTIFSHKENANIIRHSMFMNVKQIKLVKKFT